jgi:hypothetical protein
MSNVKIKKSVLQSIIKKSLSESGLHSDPSRRLVVGPDSSSLPSMLPLTPSDRMATQLEVERPPVEDPEYVPMNSKELGLALQALAEMIPADNVAEAYRDFQSVIEKINDESQKDDELDHMGGSPDFEDEDEDISVDAQLESVRRKNRRFDMLLREAEGKGGPKARLRGQSGSSKRNEDPEALAALERMKDYKPKADEDPKTRKEQMAAFGKWLVRKGITTPSTREGFSDKFKEFMRDERYQLPGREDAAAMMRDRSNDEEGDRGEASDDEEFKLTPNVSVTQILLRYPEVCDEFKIDKSRRALLSDLIDGGSITKKELITFLDAINDTFLNDKGMKRAFNSAFNAGKVDASRPAEFIRKFSDEKETSASSSDTDQKFSWRAQFKRFGYAAESGLRQAFIKDVESLFKLKNIVFPDDDANEIEASSSEAFENALNDPDNKRLLNALFDEEGIQEYIEAIGNLDYNYESSDLYRNFRGIIGYEVLSKIAELNFKPRNGKPGRQIAKAFISDQLPAPPGSKEAETDGPLTPDERKQLESIATDGTFLDFFVEFVEEHKADKYKNLLTGAAILTGDDLDVEEYGAHIEPAFATLKQLTSGKKPPDVAIKRTVDTDSPEGQAYIDSVKTASKQPKRK